MIDSGVVSDGNIEFVSIIHDVPFPVSCRDVFGLAASGLRGAVVGHHAIAVLKEEQHLACPNRQRPAVTEDDRLTFTLVF